MTKLAVFTSNRSFLGWTKRFTTKVVETPRTSSFTLKSLASKGRWFLGLNHKITSLSKWADVVFVEFLHELGHAVIRHSKKPVYIRIHRTELDTPSLFEKVNWVNVKAVIAVSEHYSKLMRHQIPKEVPIVVIPPGVDADRWPFRPSTSGKMCTWALPSARKRIYSLMLALRNHPLYIGGYSAQDRIILDTVQRHSLPHILEPEAKFPEWQWDKEYYIHNALDESFGVAIAEAMLSGLIPLVHRVPCVLDFVPEDLTFVYDSELVDLIERMQAMDADKKLAMKKRLRKTIVDGYTSERTGDMMEDLFSRDLS